MKSFRLVPASEGPRREFKISDDQEPGPANERKVEWRRTTATVPSGLSQATRTSAPIFKDPGFSPYGAPGVVNHRLAGGESEIRTAGPPRAISP